MRALYALPAILGLAACSITTTAPQQPPQVVIQQAVPAVMPVSPGPPPAPMSELVPPPPVSSQPTVWQPGHWRYSGIAGNPWSWVSGQYVALPPGASAWVPGQWQQQAGGWVWREGHWA